MTTITTPKTDSFRTLVQQTTALHADLFTLGDAIRERDVIKARMCECRDEMEARKHLAELMRAEETVTVKQVREPKLQADLSALLTDTQKAYNAAHSELSRIIKATPQQSFEAFGNLLAAAQLDRDKRNVEQANEVVTKAIRPRVLASQQEDRLHDAWRAVASSTDPFAKQVEGFKTALKWFDSVLTAQIKIADEDKRMTAACEAFCKLLGNR